MSKYGHREVAKEIAVALVLLTCLYVLDYEATAASIFCKDTSSLCSFVAILHHVQRFCTITVILSLPREIVIL
jgi:hypothetical protein